MGINMSDLVASLNIMWMGMAGLLTVMIVIALIVVLLGKFESKKIEESKE